MCSSDLTNPAIDSIREEVIMSLECYIGPEKNLVDTTEAHCQRLRLPHPILTNEELHALKGMDYRGWRSKEIDITFPKTEGPVGVAAALERICAEAEAAIADGFSLAILSDRAISADRIPLSTLMATGAVHHHLVKNALDRKSTRLNSSHALISYAVFCLKKKKTQDTCLTR